MENVFRDLYLDRSQSLLFRKDMIEKKHLMWQFGGTPCINAKMYDKYDTEYLGFKTDKRRFTISRELFDEHKKVYMNGNEKQYYCDKFFYKIDELNEK